MATKQLSVGAETIGDIAAKDLRKAEVFKQFGLEFCCDGRKPLREACENAGVEVKEVEKALENLPRELPAVPAHDYNSWELGFLSDYIVHIHHKYVIAHSPVLLELSEKIAQHHGAAHPELYEIKENITALLPELHNHQIKEEKILFPFVKKLVEHKRTGTTCGGSSSSSIESPVNMMLDDHRFAAEHIHAIAALSSDYQVPEDGCESYRLFYHKLEEFDKDLHLHVHLENNILFPKAVKLEKELNQ